MYVNVALRFSREAGVDRDGHDAVAAHKLRRTIIDVYRLYGSGADDSGDRCRPDAVRNERPDMLRHRVLMDDLRRVARYRNVLKSRDEAGVRLEAIRDKCGRAVRGLPEEIDLVAAGRAGVVLTEHIG